jgi:hypothetical protein
MEITADIEKAKNFKEAIPGESLSNIPLANAIGLSASLKSRIKIIAIAATLFFTPLLIFLVYQSISNSLRKYFPGIGLRESMALVFPYPQLLDVSTTTAITAKSRKQFWLFPFDFESDGVGLRLSDNVEVFHSLFPNYPNEMRSDVGLWDVYFRKKFNSVAWPDILNPEASELKMVFQAWQGNLEVYRRYGADGVILGSSEVGFSIIPGVVSKTVNPVIPNNKLLLLTRFALGARPVQRMADILLQLKPNKNSLQRPIKYVLWGYGVWTANDRASSVIGAEDIALEELEEYLSNQKSITLSNIVNFKGSQILPKPLWDMIFPNGIQELRRVQQEEVFHHTWNSSAGGDRIYQKESQQSFLFSGNPGFTEERLSRLAKQAKPFSGYLAPMNETACNLAEADKILNSTLESLLKVSDRVFLYLTPTTPLHWGIAPPCFRSAVIKMLENKKSDRVIVKTEGWENYGLTWSDFVKLHYKFGLYELDYNHTNLQGAQKISRIIGDWIFGNLPAKEVER